ncbi:MAG: hypothetical protein IH901_02290 [Proteobacteria bacterium]|nr:hypothetical protein [Pseudomonadota bacterium]
MLHDASVTASTSAINTTVKRFLCPKIIIFLNLPLPSFLNSGLFRIGLYPVCHIFFPIRKGIFSRHVGDVHAVDGIPFEIGPRETLSLVGKSGCGQTTAGRSLRSW